MTNNTNNKNLLILFTIAVLVFILLIIVHYSYGDRFFSIDPILVNRITR